MGGVTMDIMPKYKKPAVEVILTTLHSGGKFEQGNYIHSGGLHGVGSSVVNALARKMLVEIKKDHKKHVQSYARGKPTTPLKVDGGPVRGTGTSITFEPNRRIRASEIRRLPHLSHADRREHDAPQPRSQARLQRLSRR